MIMTCDDEPEERPPKPKRPRAVKTRYAIALAVDNYGQEHSIALAVDNDGRLTEFVQSGTRKEGKKHPPKAINDSRELLSVNRKLMNFQSLGSCIKRAGRAQKDDVTTRASTCSRSTTCAWRSSMHSNSKFATTTMTTRASAASARRHTSASAYASLSPSSSCSAYTLQVS